MTLKERVIVEVYTGYCMTSPEEKDEVYKYMAEIMGRPVFTHELADKQIQERLREKARPDFTVLCITNERWQAVVNKILELKSLSHSLEDTMYYNDMLIRYAVGERTKELYDIMTKAY